MSTICNNPFSIPVIDIDECVGTSLATINSNFQELKVNECLTFDEIQKIETNLIDLSSRYFSISSYAPRVSKAWAHFSIDPITNIPTIQSSFNIDSVTPTATGSYAITFSETLPTSGYALIGTCKETEKQIGTYPNISSTHVWVQPTTFTTTSAGINIRNISGTFAIPEYVSIAIYYN
jgi:hypothetical protein